MKICVYDWALHTIGGGQKFDCKVAEYLSRKHDVDLLSLFPIDRNKLEQVYSVNLSRIKNFRYIYKKSRINSNLLHLFGFRKVSKLAREYDLFYNAEEHETVKPTARYNILYCHFFDLKWPKPPSSVKDFLKLSFVFLAKSLFRNYAKSYDSVYCNSEYTKKWLKRKWKVDARVMYPPIDIPKKLLPKSFIKNDELLSKTKKNIILSTGRLTPDKNYELTIECFKKLYDSGIKDAKNYECWIYGSEPPIEYLAKLKKLAEGYPVKIKINPTDKELSEAYSKARIFVQAKGLGVDEEKYPALLEHFGMTPVEAMAHGCVPVLLNRGGYRESVQNNKSGFLFSTKEEATEKIKLLIKDKKLWHKLSRNARERAKRFSLERLHKELDGVMKSAEEKVK